MNHSTPSRSHARSLSALFALALGAVLTFGAPALAQTPTAEPAFAPDSVVATVGEDAITESDLAFAAEDLGQELANIPPEDRRAFLLTVLIDMKVMANAARAASMDQSDIFKRRLKYLEDRALRRAYFAEQISTTVTPETLQAAYDAYVQTFTPAEEVRARHILVATEADAKAIEAELATGVPFEKLAIEKSLDPSGAQNGGDLGFFTRGMMVKPFEDTAFAMEVGAVSAPIESQFGWHIIKLEEKRQTAPPTIEEIGPQIQQQILFENFDKVVGDLKAGLTIDIPDAALAAAVKSQSETATQ